MIENIRLSFKGIWSHKMRSFLTMLGIIIGIAAIIVIVSLIQGTNKQIEENLVGDGSHTVEIQLTSEGNAVDLTYQSLSQNLPSITEKQMEEIRAMADVENATAYLTRSWANSMYYKNTSIDSAVIYGIDGNYFRTAGYEVIAGSGITESDLNDYHKVCIIDDSLVSGVFGGKNPVGEVIDLEGECFTVKGVVKKKSSFEPVIESMADYQTYAERDSSKIYLPYTLWPSMYAYDTPRNVLVKASAVNTMTSAGKEVSDYLNEQISFQDTYKYSAQNLADRAARLQNVSASTNFLMIGIAAISLLVGGIGVMNIMLVSVTERTREIGLKKALGAKKRVILTQFLTEAALLSAIGGFFGVVIGIAASRIIAAAAMVPVAVSVPAIIVSVVFSMAIGIIFGLAPSMKAANLNPIDALRYE